jgi:hypothetical protein
VMLVCHVFHLQQPPRAQKKSQRQCFSEAGIFTSPILLPMFSTCGSSGVPAKRLEAPRELG